MKKIITLLLAFTLIASAFVTSNAVGEKDYVFYDLGEIRGEGKTDIRDVTALQKYLAGALSEDDIILAVADVNGDGNVDITDATTLQKYLAGYYVSTYPQYPDNKYLAAENNYSFEIASDDEIKSEELINTERQKVLLRPRRGVALVTSTEEFISFTNNYSTSFDDEFFEENALIFGCFEEYMSCSIRYKISSVGVSGNTLKVNVYEYYDQDQTEYNYQIDEYGGVYMVPLEWYMVYRVDKSDIADVDNAVWQEVYGYYS